MNEPWYWKLGFSTNPFGIKPAALTSEVVGRHMGPVIEKIENGSVQFIEAPLGSGKTTLLKGIISRFGGRKKLIYCSCIKDESLDVPELLKNATVKGKLFGKLSTGMILLVDEAQNISKEDAQAITGFMAAGNVKSAAFFGTDYDLSLLTEELNKSLNGNVTMLSTLSSEESIELVRQRVGNLKLMPDYVIREIYGRSNCNPRRLLQNCEQICRKAVEFSIRELTVPDVATLLKAPELASPSRKRQKKEAPAITEEKKEKPAKPKKSEAESKPAQAKQPRKAAGKRARKESKNEDAKKGQAGSAEQHMATVTYSGYNLGNIRTYEEEMSTVKQHTPEEPDEPEED